MLCPFCSEEVADGAIKCKHCSEILNRAAHDRLRDVQSSANVNEVISSLPPYYQRAFQQISANGERPTTARNWAAFLFGPFWYCYRGMWMRGGVAFLLLILTGGFWAIPFGIYACWYGNYDYYQFKVKNRHIWFV